ncbi:MAG: S16 family serine protease [Candidatus Izemoplasmataceae bacterium]
MFQKYQWFWMMYTLIAIPLFALMVTPLPYRMTSPAFVNDIDGFIQIEDAYEMEGGFYTTSVVSINQVNALQYLIATWEDSVTLSEIPASYEHVNNSDLREMSYLMKDDSLQTSLIVGLLQTEIPVDFSSHQMIYLVYDYLEEDTLKLGDYLISVNGSDDFTYEFQQTACNERASMTVLREGELLELSVLRQDLGDEGCLFGFRYGTYNELISTSINYEFIETNVGGPSGGLLQSLYVFNALTKKDYTYGLKIGGTGTIDVNGNVGYIGGVEQKIITAIRNDIDIFFVPHLSDDPTDDYIEALKIYQTFDTNMQLVGVSSISEAIAYLVQYEETNNE